MEVKLVMFKSNGQRKDLPIKNAVTLIGRGEECDLRVPVLSVSRKHCELTVSGAGVAVKDLASSNGTYVNNKRVNETKLAAGDRLVVGPVVFTIQIDGKPAEVRPVKTKGQILAESGKAGRSEDIVDLGGAISLDAPAAANVDDEIDPISALEMLAADSDDDTTAN